MMNRALRTVSLSVVVTALCTARALAVDRTAGADVPKPVVTGTQWTDGEIASLDTNVDIALAGASVIRSAHVGLLAIDARDGRVLYQRNADAAFQPASTLKLLVGSAALERLGPTYRFRTTAYAGAAVAGGALLGPLVLRGGGDVLLDDAAFADLARTLRAAGIRAVAGIAFDEPGGEPRYLPGWSWDDLPWYYAAPVTQLGFNDNAVALRVTPGAAPGAPVTVAISPWGEVCAPAGECRSDLGFGVRVRATTGARGSESTLDVHPGASGEVAVVGALAVDAKPETLSIAVPDPPRYAAFAAARALRAGGIALPPGAAIGPLDAVPATPPEPLWSHGSEPLRDLLADLWFPSDNLLAEELLRAVAGGPTGVPGGTAEGIAFEKAWLKGFGVDVDALALSDGSGLSTYDRITPRALVAILKHDWDGPNRDIVLDDLPIAGVRGTLRAGYAGTAIEKRVFAKTGSLSHVSALAGYAANAQHGAVIFAFLVDDWVGDASALRDLRARVLAQFVER